MNTPAPLWYRLFLSTPLSQRCRVGDRLDTVPWEWLWAYLDPSSAALCVEKTRQRLCNSLLMGVALGMGTTLQMMSVHWLSLFLSSILLLMLVCDIKGAQLHLKQAVLRRQASSSVSFDEACRLEEVRAAAAALGREMPVPSSPTASLRSMRRL